MRKARHNSRRAGGRSRVVDGGNDWDLGRHSSLFAPHGVEDDPLTGSLAEVRTVQPFAAMKSYVCPGCNQEIRKGTGHLVVVPFADPSERRHWHNGCWQHRHRRPMR